MRIFALSTAVIIGTLLSASTSFAQQGGATTGGQSLQAQGIEAQQATGGTITGSERFLRENQEVGQVIGGSTEGVGNIRGGGDAAAGQAGRGGASQLNRRGMQNMLNQFNRNTSRNTQRQLSRVPFEIGFALPPAAPPSQTSARIQMRLNRIAQVRRMGQVSLDVEGRIAVLQGQVASANDRELVAKLVLMEPGISDVRNELTLLQETPPPPLPLLPQ